MAEGISFKNVVKVAHIVGAEPAGIVLRFATASGEEINLYFSKDRVIETRDMLTKALDSGEYLRSKKEVQ